MYLSLDNLHASANRGACLQLCRRKYTVRDAEEGTELLVDGKYILSPKDLCTIGFLDKMKSIFGISETQGMMFLSRSLYAMVSLFTVSMIYRICDLASNKQTAWLLALIPSISIVMPSFGIIENASAFLGLPLMLYGANVILRQEVLRKNNLTDNVHRTSFLIAGIMLGLGICFWYESIFVVFSILLILCFRHNYKGTIMTFIGMIASIAFIWLLLIILNVNPLNYIKL